MVILILTEPRWWGNDIDKITPNQTINIRNADWIFRCLGLTLQMEYFRYIVSLLRQESCVVESDSFCNWIVNYAMTRTLNEKWHDCTCTWDDSCATVFNPSTLFSLYNSLWLTKWLETVSFMMTSSNGNISRVTDPLCHRWIPLTKASDVKLWCFLWSAPERTVE